MKNYKFNFRILGLFKIIEIHTMLTYIELLTFAKNKH